MLANYSERKTITGNNAGGVRKKFLFDAGASRFNSGPGGASTEWFVNEYNKRGIHFDAIYGWEARKMNMSKYYEEVPADVRVKLHTYNVPASIDPYSADNPLARLVSSCEVEDFCVLKIDVDTPSVEIPWIQQILQCEHVSSRIDEFFFEHHVHGDMQYHGWGSKVMGYFSDTYHLLSEMRFRGIRAHSWV